MRSWIIHQFFVLTACLLLLQAPPLDAVEPPEPLAPLPSPRQLAWHEDDLTLFIHFGMNTYTGRGTGWGNEDPDLFNPVKLDCRQWARVATECGFKGIVFTARHHDGFCLWPSKTTKHSVASSIWRGGKGDVVREVSDACREAGLKFGVYCSPADYSQKSFKDAKDRYAEFYRAQLAELLSDYGPVYEMWFDGYRAVVNDWPKVIDLVRELQPDTIIKEGPRFFPIRDDVRWVGNELASALLANWYVYPAPDQPSGHERVWFPVECDTSMIGHWFWQDTLPLDLPTLLNYYYTSVGRGSIFLLNVAPNREGRFSDESVACLREFHAAITQIYNPDFATGTKATASNVRGNDPAFGPAMAIDNKKDTYWTTDDGVTSAWLEVDLGGEKEFNVVRMEEAIRLGQRVAKYRLDVWDDATGDWNPVNEGFTIGRRKLDRIPKVKSSKVRLTILESRACPTIRAFGVHLDEVSPPEHFEPKFANAEIRWKARMPRQKPIPTANDTN